MFQKEIGQHLPAIVAVLAIIALVTVSVGNSPALYSQGFRLHRSSSSSTTLPQTSKFTTTSTIYNTVTSTVTSVETSTSYTTLTNFTTITDSTTATFDTTLSTTTTVMSTAPPPYSSNGCIDAISEQNGITCTWLQQQAVAWQPATNASIGWTAQFAKGSYDNVENNSLQAATSDLSMLLQSGATCIRMDIGFDPWLLNNATAQNEITSLVNSIRADGKCLVVADAAAEYYRENPIPWSDFQSAWVSRVQTIAGLYHPDFYIVIKEPYWYMDMISDNTTNPQIKNVTAWTALTQSLANTVQGASPFTKVGISIGFGYVNSQYYISYLSSLANIPNLEFVGFDVYTSSDFASVQSYISQSGLIKKIWIAEAWSAPSAYAFSSDRSSLDQLWIQDLYYYGLYIHAVNLNPFFTDCFASYTFGDASYSARTPVFYEYQHLATTYDGSLQ